MDDQELREGGDVSPRHANTVRVYVLAGSLAKVGIPFQAVARPVVLLAT
jgi:hypothetical protein